MRSLARPLTHGPLTKGVQGLGPGTCFNAAHSVRLFYLPPIISHLLLRGYCQAMSRQRAAAGVADADSVLVPTHIRDLGRAGGAQGLQVGALPCRVLSLLGRRPAAHVRVPPVGCSRAIARRCLCHANAQISHPVTLLFGDVPGKAVDVQSGRPASIFHVQLRLCVLHARCKPRVIYIYIFAPFDLHAENPTRGTTTVIYKAEYKDPLELLRVRFMGGKPRAIRRDIRRPGPRGGWALHWLAALHVV